MVGKKGIAPAALALLLLIGVPLGMYVADVPVTKVQIGNETITVTTRDLVLRITAPIRHSVENIYIHINPQAKKAIEVSISEVYDDLIDALNNKLLQTDIIKERWPSIVNMVEEYNYNRTGNRVPYINICIFKGPVEICKTLKLNDEEPGIELVKENATETYLTIRIPYGVAVSIIQKVEQGDLEKALQLIIKETVRGEIELPVNIMKNVQTEISIKKPAHPPRYPLPEVVIPK